MGNVTQQREDWTNQTGRGSGEVRITSMVYDGTGRLTSEAVATTPGSTITTAYVYDDANNRTRKTVAGGMEPGVWDYSFNSANQLVNWNKKSSLSATPTQTATLLYDASGNRTRQMINGQFDGSTTNTTRVTDYAWDSLGRLNGVEMHNGRNFNYQYDYRTRRIGITEAASTVTVGGKQTKVVFSGGLSIAEWETTGGTTPNTNISATVEYTRGPDMGGGVGGLLYTKRADVVKYDVSNGRGDIVLQTTANKTVSWTASYEAFGKRTKETGTNADKQRANTKDEDPTGLLNEGFRYRDLETGVWLSRDPAGLVDGPNVYAYVKQSPWTAFDPDGLFEVGVPGVSQPNHETITRKAFAASMGVSSEDGLKAAIKTDPLIGFSAYAAGKGSRHHDTGKFTMATAGKMTAGYMAGGKSGAGKAFLVERAEQIVVSHYGSGQSNHSMSPTIFPFLGHTQIRRDPTCVAHQKRLESSI